MNYYNIYHLLFVQVLVLYFLESAESSTWGELKAIQLALLSYKEQLRGRSVKNIDIKNYVTFV